MRLVFVPIHQNIDYDYPISKSIFEMPTLLSLLFLTGVFIAAKGLFSKYKLVSFSIFWFFLALLPESSIFPIKDVIFEHRLYLPLVGFCVFLVSGLYYLLGSTTTYAAMAIIIIFYSILTCQRNNVWKDDFTLWNDAIIKSPHKARPYEGRGLISFNRGGLTQAISDYNKAIDLDPKFADAFINRGMAYAKGGHENRAILDYNKAIALNPRNANAYFNRGLAYTQEGDYKQAVFDYSKVIKINPKDAESYANRGAIYYKEGDFSQALSDYDKAIDIDPAIAGLYKDLKKALGRGQ